MLKAIVLFSGGLDSLVTALTLRRLGVEVLALNIVTPLHDVSQAAMLRAEEYGLPLRVCRADESYADLIVQPRWGYGSAVNPCIDCRIAMLKLARQVMQAEQADFIATGEVVGQRPNSQKMHQLALIAREAGVTDCLVRPLSARAMHPSKVELDGLIDRESLHGFTGRGRLGLMRLAEELGVREFPQPASGCLLCEKTFAPRVRDVLRHNPKPTNWHFEVLPFGRVVRMDPKAQCVVARNLGDCRNLVRLFERDARPRAALFEPDNFTGPAALLIGDEYGEHHECIAGGQVLRFSNPNRYEPDNAFVRFRDADRDELRKIFIDPNATQYKHY
jgi:rRNA maturation protein Nop10